MSVKLECYRADEPPAGYEKTGRRKPVKNEGAAQPPPVRIWPRPQDALNPCDTRWSNSGQRPRGGFFSRQPGTLAMPYPQPGTLRSNK